MRVLIVQSVFIIHISYGILNLLLISELANTELMTIEPFQL